MHPRWQKGGVETTNERWARILSKQNFKPIALTYNAQVVDVKGIQLINFSSLIDILIYVVRNLRRTDTLLLCQSYFLIKTLPFLIFLKFKGCRVFLAERNSFDQYNGFPIKRKLYSLIFPWIFKIFDKIIINSSDMASETIYRKCQENIVVFKNPRFTKEELKILESFQPNKSGNSVYTFCRWNEQKDPDFLITAADFFTKKSVEFTVFCNDDSQSFQRPFVTSALVHMMENPSIVFFCSKFEGYPNLLLEARVLGLPIIYSHCNTGVNEILNGYDLAFKFEKESLTTLEHAYECASEAAMIHPCVHDLELAKKHSEEHVNTNEFVMAFLNE